MSDGVRIGVDVGGTFTDVVVSRGGATVHGKSDTTAFDLRVGVTNAIEEAAQLFEMTGPELLGLRLAMRQPSLYERSAGPRSVLQRLQIHLLAGSSISKYSVTLTLI